MNSTADRVATHVLAIAAVVAVGVMVYDRTRPPRPDIYARPVALVENWERAVAVATPELKQRNAISVLEFVDLECPFCADFDSTMIALKAVMGDTIDVQFVHMPITGHRFARAGAVAIECAALEKKEREFISRVYAQQDSIGLKSWSRYASDAGIQDSRRFDSCLTSAAIAARVDSAAQVSKALKIPGTPTVLIEGWSFSNAPSVEKLASAVRAVKRGKSPA